MEFPFLKVHKNSNLSTPAIFMGIKDTASLKDLRNAIAHNDVVYDTRFRKIDASKSMKQCY